jgi:hypothetical protein
VTTHLDDVVEALDEIMVIRAVRIDWMSAITNVANAIAGHVHDDVLVWHAWIVGYSNVAM